MAEKTRAECEERLLNMIELGYTAVGLRARAEKTVQFFTSALKHLQNLQQVQQEIMPFIRDVARQWMDSVISFDTTTRQFAISLTGVIDVCTKDWVQAGGHNDIHRPADRHDTRCTSNTQGSKN